jgi:hypothetical protein
VPDIPPGHHQEQELEGGSKQPGGQAISKASSLGKLTISTLVS